MLMAKITQNKYMAATFIDKYMSDYIMKYMYKITEDLEISQIIANWAYTVEEGESMIFREGIVEIIDDGE